MSARRPCRLGSIGAIACIAVSSRVEARAWRLESGASTPRISEWGADCGPRPLPATLTPGPIYEESPDGTLTGPRGAPPLFGPGLCRALTQQPDLRETRAGETMTCASTEGAAKRVEGRATRRDDGATLRVDHEVSYAWTLKGTPCAVAVVTRHVLVDTAPPPPPAACARPGAPARLVPAGAQRRLLRAGGRTSLSVRALDANGCDVAVHPTWITSAGRMDADGTFEARDMAPGATAVVSARLEALSVEFQVRVAADEADYAALTVAEPTLVDGHLPVLPPQRGEALSGAAAEEAPGPGAALRGRLLVGAFVGLLVLAAGLGLFIAVRAARRRRDRSADVLDAHARDVLARSAAARRTPSSRATPGRICPACGTTYPADAEFCGTDGARLTRLN